MRNGWIVRPGIARNPEYKKVLETIQAGGKCPFCPDNFKHHKHPILKESGSWFLTKIGWPYDNARFHFVIIGRNHKENFPELVGSDLINIRSLVNWAIRRFKIKGGALAIRFGHGNYTGASVNHLHAHLIVPRRKKVVLFPIG